MPSTFRLGILTFHNGSHLEEKRFFTDLAKEAEKLNTDVFVFSPADVLSNGRIRALCYGKGEGWKQSIVPQPDVVFDRFRNMKPEAFRTFVEFRQKTKLPFLNSRLAHKWNLHLYLSSHPVIAKWLPETLFFTGMKDIQQLFTRYPKVYLKPVNGTGGKGILTISKNDGAYWVNGRDMNRKKMTRQFFTPFELQAFLQTWTKNTKYIVQQGLDLHWLKDSVTDFRLLVQKGAKGSWGITGMVGKIGEKNSVTSNLHGGGRAVDPRLFLSKFVSEDQYKEILSECYQLGLLVAEFLEERFGQLVELGIDLGIDRNGKVWIIEVNPKPGRELFREVGDLVTYRKAVNNPIKYALFLKEKGKGIKL
jgi:glutathione synthase/RimK-type ligase-like ATP-grasp enzyme